MKKLLVALIVSLFVATSAHAEKYALNVTRTGNNTYKTMDGIIVITMLCLELALSEDVTLIWDYPQGTEHLYGGKLIFHSSGTVCDVKAVY